MKQFNAKQYAQAVGSFQHAATIAPNDPETLELLAQGMGAAGQRRQCRRSVRKGHSGSARSRPEAERGAIYRRAVSAAYEAKSPVAVDLARDWASAYPSADSWKNSIAIFRSLKQPDVEGTLDMLRLMQRTGALTHPRRICAFCGIGSANQSNYNEAQAVIDAGHRSEGGRSVEPAVPRHRQRPEGQAEGDGGRPRGGGEDVAAARQPASHR